MTTNAKRILLGGLLVCWALLLGVRLLTRPEPMTAAPTTATAVARQPAFSALAVRFDLLDAPRPEPPASPKNLFAALMTPQSAPPPAPPPSAPPPEPAPPPAGPTPEELERERVTKELGRYRYLGYLKKGSEQEGFLSTGEELLTVHSGEVVPPNGRYRVTALTDEILRIHDPQTSVEMTLALTGK